MYKQYVKLCALFSIFAFISGENECGIVAQAKNNRIVGGQVIGYVKYPWYAALVLLTNRDQLVCGGSLIHKKYILTAAHCYRSFFKEQQAGILELENLYVAKLGIDNICIPDPNIQIFDIKKVYIKEEYYTDFRYNDIAILLLNSEANGFTPICLPLARYESNNRTNLISTIIGLGKESSKAWRLPCQVKEAKVEIQPDSVCRKFLDNNKEKGSDLEGAFCAGNGAGEIDTCQGDSGGPLQVPMENDQFILLGVTSFGFGCAKAGTYGVYTDVSHYLDWVHSIINIDSNINGPRELIITPSDATTGSRPRSRKHQEGTNPWNMLKEILNW